MTMFLIFCASFFQVFLLGLNSQFVRNQWVIHVFITSWFISVAQFTYTKIVAMGEGAEVLYLFFASGMGGALGIVSSIFFYRWLLPKINKGNK